MLAKNIALKVTKAVIISIDTCKQDMIEVGNENKKNKNEDRWNHCNHMPMKLLLGTNHLLPLFHMSKLFIWIEETKESINEFSLGYMINPRLNINKSFIEQVIKRMNTIFGEITQPYIITTLEKINTRVLELLFFYETRQNPKKCFRVLSCVLYTIISHYVCID